MPQCCTVEFDLVLSRLRPTHKTYRGVCLLFSNKANQDLLLASSDDWRNSAVKWGVDLRTVANSTDVMSQGTCSTHTYTHGSARRSLLQQSLVQHLSWRSHVNAGHAYNTIWRRSMGRYDCGWVLSRWCWFWRWRRYQTPPPPPPPPA